MIDLSNLRQATQHVRREFWRLFEFDLFFKILALVLLQPLVAWLIGLTVSSTGYPAISNDQLLSFFLSVPGVLAILIFGAGTFAIFFAEQAGLQIIDLAFRTGRKLNAIEVLWLTFTRLRRLTKLGGVMIVLSLMAAIPILTVIAIAYLSLLSGADINYYLAERPPEFWGAIAVGLIAFIAAIAIAVRLYGRWILVVPVVMYEGVGAKAALRRSAQLGRDRNVRWTRTVFAWTFTLLVVAALITALFSQLGTIAVKALDDQVQLTLAVLGAIMIVYIACIALLSFVGIAVNSVYTNLLYAQALEGADLSSALDLVPERSDAALSRFRKANAAAWLAAVVLLAGSAVTAFLVAHNLGDKDPPAITAHRGSSARAPENTIAAIEAAIEDGADYAEIDVQETADGTIVMLHDADLMRLAGVDLKVWETDYASLRELEVGGWFAPEFRGERIATLEQVIELARGSIDLNIELKYNGHDVDLAGRVVAIIREYDFLEHAVVSSLEIEGLRQVEELDGRIRTGYIVATAVGNLGRFDVDFFAISTRFANADRVERLQRSGSEVHVWTVNDRREMSAFIDMGVDNILTDYPAVLREMLQEKAELDEAQRILIAFRNWLRG